MWYRIIASSLQAVLNICYLYINAAVFNQLISPTFCEQSAITTNILQATKSHYKSNSMKYVPLSIILPHKSKAIIPQHRRSGGMSGYNIWFSCGTHCCQWQYFLISLLIAIYIQENEIMSTPLPVWFIPVYVTCFLLDLNLVGKTFVKLFFHTNSHFFQNVSIKTNWMRCQALFPRKTTKII